MAQGAGHRAQGTERRAQGAEHRAQSAGHRERSSLPRTLLRGNPDHFVGRAQGTEQMLATSLDTHPFFLLVIYLEAGLPTEGTRVSRIVTRNINPKTTDYH